MTHAFRCARHVMPLLPLVVLGACATRATVERPADITSRLALPPYDGPLAAVAVGPCENRAGGTGSFTVSTPQGETQVSLGDEIGTGMADMLITALANTNRFRVFEISASVIEAIDRGGAIRDPAAPAADLLVTCGVTEFEPRASGLAAGAASRLGGVLGGVLGATSTSSVGIDLRLVDAATREIVTAFSVRGEARDVSAGGILAGMTGPVGGLGGFNNTPIEAAVRLALLEAVKELAGVTPERYFRHGR